MQLKPIGIIHSNYKTMKEAPAQGRMSNGIQEIEVYREFLTGLKNIDSYSYLIILYWLDKADRNNLLNKMYNGNELKGVFSTRSPNRPNPIAFSIAELISCEDNRLIVKGIEAVDGSYLLDIKPYFSDLECIESVDKSPI